MAFNDALSDMLARIKNAHKAKKSFTSCYKSKLNLNVLSVYSKISDLEKPYGGLGISILSTPKGVMSDQQARKNNVGGEILCEVF